MQKRLTLSLVFLCVLAALALVFSFLRFPFLGNLVFPYDSSNNPVNIVLKFGVGARNELNTFNGTFTKDLIIDGTITTRLILSQEELSQIQKRLSDIGFFEYPETFPSQRVVTPRSDYYLRIQNGSSVKEVTWYSDSMLGARTEDLQHLCSFLTNMIMEKLE